MNNYHKKTRQKEETGYIINNEMGTFLKLWMNVYFYYQLNQLFLLSKLIQIVCQEQMFIE